MHIKALFFLLLTGFSHASQQQQQQPELQALEIRQPAAIYNYGNFCFMASYLQSLFACPEFRQALLMFNGNQVQNENQGRVVRGLQTALAKWLVAPHVRVEGQNESASIYLKADLDPILKEIINVATNSDGGLIGDDAILPAISLLANLPPALREFLTIKTDDGYGPVLAVQVLPKITNDQLENFMISKNGEYILGLDRSIQELVKAAFIAGNYDRAPNVLTVTLPRRIDDTPAPEYGPDGKALPVKTISKYLEYPIPINTSFDLVNPASDANRPLVSYQLMGITVYSGGYHYYGYTRLCQAKGSLSCTWFKVNDEAITALTDAEFNNLLQGDIATKFTILTYVDAPSQRLELLGTAYQSPRLWAEFGQQVHNQHAAYLQRMAEMVARQKAAMTKFSWNGKTRDMERRLEQLLTKESETTAKEKEELELILMALNTGQSQEKKARDEKIPTESEGTRITIGKKKSPVVPPRVVAPATSRGEPMGTEVQPRRHVVPRRTLTPPPPSPEHQRLVSRLSQLNEIILALEEVGDANEQLEQLKEEQTQVQKDLELLQSQAQRGQAQPSRDQALESFTEDTMEIDSDNARRVQEKAARQSLADELSALRNRIEQLQELLMKRGVSEAQRDEYQMEAIELAERVSQIEAQLAQFN